MGCSQSKANDVEPPNKCGRVAADRPRESAAVSVESRKVPRQAAETNQAPDSHPREHASKDKHEEAVCHQSSSASISDALDLASLRQEMKSDGDIAKTVVRIEVSNCKPKSPACKRD